MRRTRSSGAARRAPRRTSPSRRPRRPARAPARAGSTAAPKIDPWSSVTSAPRTSPSRSRPEPSQATAWSPCAFRNTARPTDEAAPRTSSAERTTGSFTCVHEPERLGVRDDPGRLVARAARAPLRARERPRARRPSRGRAGSSRSRRSGASAPRGGPPARPPARPAGPSRRRGRRARRGFADRSPRRAGAGRPAWRGTIPNRSTSSAETNEIAAGSGLDVVADAGEAVGAGEGARELPLVRRCRARGGSSRAVLREDRLVCSAGLKLLRRCRRSSRPRMSPMRCSMRCSMRAPPCLGSG